MQAFFNEKFNKGFILSETELTKICDIIDGRIKEKNYLLKFRIHREDNILIHYDDKHSVLTEENSKTNRVSRLEIFSENQKFNINLVFDKNDSVELSISSDDRDIVNLLSSDLRSYLKADVLILRSIKTIQFIKIIIPILMIASLAIMTFFMYELTSVINPDEVNHILSSSDLHQKINYLITRNIDKNVSFETLRILPILSGSIILLFLSLIIPIRKVINYIFPVNIFYWGREKGRYDKHKEIKKQIIWGIIVAFIVSILAGYVMK